MFREFLTMNCRLLDDCSVKNRKLWDILLLLSIFPPLIKCDEWSWDEWSAVRCDSWLGIRIPLLNRSYDWGTGEFVPWRPVVGWETSLPTTVPPIPLIFDSYNGQLSNSPPRLPAISSSHGFRWTSTSSSEYHRNRVDIGEGSLLKKWSLE